MCVRFHPSRDLSPRAARSDALFSDLCSSIARFASSSSSFSSRPSFAAAAIAPVGSRFTSTAPARARAASFMRTLMGVCRVVVVVVVVVVARAIVPPRVARCGRRDDAAGSSPVGRAVDGARCESARCGI